MNRDYPPGAFMKQDMPTRHETAKARKVAAEAAWREVCRDVDARDGKQCRCCDKRSDPDATGLLTRGHRHHIVYRSAGGPDADWNLITLCADCHNAEHKNHLRIDGPTAPIDANGPVLFLRKGDDEVWYVDREEIAVRMVRRD